MGVTKANAQVAGFLFTAAKNGNVTAQIFWLKTRARWKDAPVEHKVDVTQLTDEALERMIAQLTDPSALPRVSGKPVLPHSHDAFVLAGD